MYQRIVRNALMIVGAWIAGSFVAVDAVQAAVPQKINYQGYLTDAANQPLNTTVTMVLKLYSVASGGSPLYTESQSVPVSNGLFQVAIGAVSPLALPFDVPYFLGVTVGTDAEMSPRQAVLTSPYALQAANALSLAPAATVIGTQVTGAISNATLSTGNLTGTIGAAQIAGNAVTTVKIADASVTKPKLSASGGASGQVLGTDGTSLVWVTPSTSGFPTKPIDRTTVIQANAGSHASMTIGADGLPVIAYYDDSAHDLSVAHCNDIGCATFTAHPVDATGDVGQFPSIAIGTTGFPVISYYDVTNQALKIAFCADAACGSATVQTVDTTNNVGQHSSLVFSAIPFISYYDATAHVLKLAQCNGGTSCNSPTVSIIDNTSADVGKFTSMIVGSGKSGVLFGPIIAYYDTTNARIKLALCNSFDCNTPVLRTVLTASVANPVVTLALGESRERFPFFGYTRMNGTTEERLVTLCVDVTCLNAATTKSLDSSAQPAVPTTTSSATLGSDGFPVIALSGNSVYRCLSTDCSNFSRGQDGGNAKSVTIGTDGMPIVATQSGGSLLVEHCGNIACFTGFVRAR